MHSLSSTTNLAWKHSGGQKHVCKGTSQQNFQAATECRDERFCMRMKAILPKGQSEAGANHLPNEMEDDTLVFRRIVFCCLQFAGYSEQVDHQQW